MRVGRQVEPEAQIQAVIASCRVTFRIAVDRGVEHRPALGLRKVGHVAPAAREVDPGRSPDPHRLTRAHATRAITSDRSPVTIATRPASSPAIARSLLIASRPQESRRITSATYGPQPRCFRIVQGSSAPDPRT